MSLVATLLMALVTYLVMRRRGRVFLESEEAIIMAVYAMLAMAQRIYAGNVNLDDFVATPVYFAIPVVIGHARAPARGAAAAMLGGWTLCVVALALTPDPTTGGPLAGLPGQYLLIIGMLGLTGAVAGLNAIPKALKPLFTGSYLVLVAAYHPEYLHSLAPFIIQFTAMALSCLGLILNPFKARPVPMVHYPTSPSRRD
jgi:hypothetical protein